MAPFFHRQKAHPTPSDVTGDHVVHVSPTHADPYLDGVSGSRPTKGTQPTKPAEPMGMSVQPSSSDGSTENGNDANFRDAVSLNDRRFYPEPPEGASSIRRLLTYLLRHFLLFAPLAIALGIPMIITNTVAYDAPLGKERLFWLFTWLETSWACLWFSVIAADLLPPVFRFLMGYVNPSWRKYWLCLNSLKFPLALTWWGVLSLIMFSAVS